MKDIDPIDLLETQKIDENRVSEGSQKEKKCRKTRKSAKNGFLREIPRKPENYRKLGQIMENYVKNEHRSEKKVQNFPEICQKMAKKGHFSGVLRGAETTKMGKVPPDPPEFRWAFVHPRT